MLRPLSPREEVRQLADAVYDRSISASAMQRLEDLIGNDLGCLQAYLERIDFHGILLGYAIERHSGNLAMMTMNQIARSSSRSQRRKAWGLTTLLLACGVLMVGAFGWLASAVRTSPHGVATITNLTYDLRSNSPVDLGQIVHNGSIVDLSEGIASLAFPNVMMDVLGASRIRTIDERHVELLSGSVHAYVRPGGAGFTVRTPDSVIVDLGTEFIVSYSPEAGTEVSVRRGRVQATLLDPQGTPLKVLDMTTQRSAVLSQNEKSIQEVNFVPDSFQRIDKVRGMIRSIDGTLRTIAGPPAFLTRGALQTRNHMLIIPERSHVVLKEDLQLVELTGPVLIPAGTEVSSYLIHYDPDILMTKAPRGSVTFEGRVAAVLVSASQLALTDRDFGLESATYETADTRELELDEDEIQISEDRKTVSFYLGVTGAEPLDQTRILVIE